MGTFKTTGRIQVSSPVSVHLWTSDSLEDLFPLPHRLPRGEVV